MFLVQNLCLSIEVNTGTEKFAYFNTQTGEIYVGLLDKITQFCDNHGYTYEFVDNKFYGLPFETNLTISKEGVKDYMNCSK